MKRRGKSPDPALPADDPGRPGADPAAAARGAIVPGAGSRPGTAPPIRSDGRFARGDGRKRRGGAKQKAFVSVGPLSIKGLYGAAIIRPGVKDKTIREIAKGLSGGGKLGLDYLELGAKLFDQTEPEAGKVVHFHLHTNVDFTKLDQAALNNGLVPPLARRADGETNGHGG